MWVHDAPLTIQPRSSPPSTSCSATGSSARLPVNRQKAIHAREGLPLARSKICSWHQQLAALVEPLVEAVFADAFKSPYVCVDARLATNVCALEEHPAKM